ncbi:MAG: tRNA pseudouridine(55) synthase TruB [Acidobacteriota bacterium]
MAEGPARGGILVLDKPPGMSSHDVVSVARRHLRPMKVGHTGTLDPFATGVLPLVVGHATRLAQFFSGAEKTYEARLRFGQTTDSYDLTGSVTWEAPAGTAWPSPQAVREALDGFLGPLMQVPPAFSAKMTDGVRAYQKARRGVAVDLPAVAVTLHGADIVGIDADHVDIRLTCSAGFYVRSLAHDLGARLGVGAHLVSLRRTRNGPFDLASAITLDIVVGAGDQLHTRLVPLDALLTEFPSVALTATGVEYVRHGRDIGPGEILDAPANGPWPERVRLTSPEGILLAIAEPGPGPVLHPAVVLV